MCKCRDIHIPKHGYLSLHCSLHTAQLLQLCWGCFSPASAFISFFPSSGFSSFPHPLDFFPFPRALDLFFFLNLWIFLFFPIFWISYFFSSSGFLSFPPSSGFLSFSPSSGFLSFRNSNLSTTLSWGQGKRLQNTLGGCFWAASWATGDFKNTSPKQTHL